MPSSDAKRSPSPSRIQRFERLRARLLPPVNGPRRLLRKFSGSSVDNRSPPPGSGIDDTYLGGALPEDPFAPGPMSIISHRKSSSATTMRRRQSPHQKPCPPAPPSSPAAGTTDFPSHGLGSLSEGDMTLDFPALDCSESSSKCSSLTSEATFHTCPTSGSETLNSEEEGQILYMPQDYESTPYGEWPSSAPSVIGHPKCSLPQEHHHVVEIDTRCVPAPIATDLSATMFAHKAAGDLSPVSIPAASVAYYRRHDACVHRRTVSSCSLPLARKGAKAHETLSKTNYSHQRAYSGN